MEFKAGNSVWFSIVRVWVFITTNIFYRRSLFLGVQEIPKDAGVIFAPNHQSAFMDAIMCSEMLKTQNRYLVRADIFKKPFAAKILTSMNLLPIYRLRDGVDSMEKNEAIFKTSEDALLRKETMIIFPEGNQADRWQLRPLKKGYARIAFGALKRSGDHFPLYMVPVGINYYNFTDYRGELVVQYGEAIDLRPYKKLLEENEAKAINELKRALEERIPKLMFDIRDEANYDAIKAVSHLLVSMDEELIIDFERRKLFFKACGDLVTETEFKESVFSISNYLEEKGVNAEDLRMARNGKLSIILKPFFILIALVTKFANAPLMMPIENFIKNKVKDHHFHASLRFTMCNFIFPFYYGFLLLIACLIGGWRFGSSFIVGLSILSYLGVLIKDKLKYNQKRNEIVEKVGDFETFDSLIQLEIEKINQKL
jgi:1-acyl-sn-glycerol-3-phosphate acyltransferase